MREALRYFYLQNGGFSEYRHRSVILVMHRRGVIYGFRKPT